jgi:hypothetical protein
MHATSVFVETTPEQAGVGRVNRTAAPSQEWCDLDDFQRGEVIRWLKGIDEAYPELVAPLLFKAGYTSIDKLLLNRMNRNSLQKLQDYFKRSVGLPLYDAEIVAIHVKSLYYHEIVRKGYWYRYFCHYYDACHHRKTTTCVVSTCG